jgi:hypothetical protein
MEDITIIMTYDAMTMTIGFEMKSVLSIIMTSAAAEY